MILSLIPNAPGLRPIPEHACVIIVVSEPLLLLTCAIKDYVAESTLLSLVRIFSVRKS